MIGTILINKYYIDKEVGSGGMALVYKAHRLSDGSVVAIKMLRAEHRNKADYLRRFESEARAVMSLSHRNIIKLYEVSVHNDTPFLVLEYAPGRTLKEIIAEHAPLEPRLAIGYAAQILAALSHAHEKGIIHRDVKPQNVIISDRGHVKLTDFGIARDVSATTRTYSGDTVLGSVHYISPEQANGEDSTQQSDIYAVGIMLYEMLTGKLPYDGDSPVAIALMHIQKSIVFPSNDEDNAPPAIYQDIILKACSKDPAERYGSAREMRKELIYTLEHPEGVPKTREKKHRKAKPRQSDVALKRIWIIPIVMIALVVGIVGLAFGLNSNNPVSNTVAVPQLVGRTLSEAEEYAKLRDFTIAVEAWEASTEYPEGYVIAQDPENGSKNAANNRISVIVSSGMDSILVPTVIGMTQTDAINTLRAYNLNPIVVPIYSEAPAGQVVRQEPSAGVELSSNEDVTIYVSNISEVADEIPNVMGNALNSAIKELQALGYTKIRIRTTSNSTATDGTIIEQNPTGGTLWLFDDTINLVIAKVNADTYSADIAFNVDIANIGDAVMITAITQDGVEVVLYEATSATSGSIVVSITGKLWLSGSHECVLYVNSNEVKRTMLTFTYRG